MVFDVVDDQRVREALIRGIRMQWLDAPCDGSPVLYVHGVPDDGAMWIPFLERTGGISPDLPGFGGSAKPRYHPYGIAQIADQLEGLLDQPSVERFRLVVHDWGGAALAPAQRIPDRVERLVIIDALPMLPGYHWHRIARIWRAPIAGALFMRLATKEALRFISREAHVANRPMPQEFTDSVWSHFDRDTRAAILRLTAAHPRRCSPATEIACTGAPPTLVLWGERDPYLPSWCAEAYGRALPNATVELVPDASHWSWIDRPNVIDRVAAFLDGSRGPNLDHQPTIIGVQS
jgi:pimeloyl-ACP methyl ester carboxylesterase